MKYLLIWAAVCISLKTVSGAGAGRAIPIATENYVEKQFKSVNPRIEYDATNFLVDLSGNYANCRFDRTREMSVALRNSPDGSTIGIIQDHTVGEETHTGAVDKYLRPVFDNWIYGNDRVYSEFRGQIQNADKFGCSVRPGCNGRVSVSCLFSPASKGGRPITPKPTPRPTQRYTPRPYPTTRWPPIRPTRYPTRPPITPIPPLRGSVFMNAFQKRSRDQLAKAFTEQQYDEAEIITGQNWDNSHYLENLSGYETHCSMVNMKKWMFPYATAKAMERGLDVIGLFGVTENKGSTPKALDIILVNMKRISSKEVGCSLIPDCFLNNDPKMYVVVSCVFEI